MATNPLTNSVVGRVTPAEVASQSGEDFLKGMMDGRYPMPPMSAVIPVAFAEVSRGTVALRSLPREEFGNPLGTVHGGYAATLLDTAMSCAVHSTLAAGEAYTTLEFKISLHKAITPATGELRAEGKIVMRGSRVASAEGRIVDKDSNVYATGSSTCLVFQIRGA
jgi:uncharacterized protein (TIGR00369 family)